MTMKSRKEGSLASWCPSCKLEILDPLSGPDLTDFGVKKGDPIVVWRCHFCGAHWCDSSKRTSKRSKR